MSAASPGARTWSARSITATRAIGLALALLATPALAGDAIDRIVGAASLARLDLIPGEAALRQRCGSDGLCAAREVAEKLGPRARLDRVRHPDTDTIRWVTTPASVVVHGSRPAPGRIEIRSFGRKVLRELGAALATSGAAGAGRSELVLDLRRNGGGDFERMLEVAGLLLGPMPRALSLQDAEGLTWRALDGARERGWRVRRVLIGPRTASSAEILAALLAAHGGAQLCGHARTAGKSFLQSVVQVDHDWRLLIERARVEVPGADLANGLIPDQTC